MGEYRGEKGLFYNPENLLPKGTSFLLIKEKDTKNDTISDLNRKNVYRLNMEISEKTIISLFGKIPEKPDKGKKSDFFLV